MKRCMTAVLVAVYILVAAGPIAADDPKVGRAAALQGRALDKRISLRFNDVDLVGVYEALSEISAMKFELDAGERSRATMDLRDMSVRQVLATLQRMYELEYAQDAHRILVRKAPGRR